MCYFSSSFRITTYSDMINIWIQLIIYFEGILRVLETFKTYSKMNIHNSLQTELLKTIKHSF